MLGLPGIQSITIATNTNTATLVLSDESIINEINILCANSKGKAYTSPIWQCVYRRALMINKAQLFIHVTV